MSRENIYDEVDRISPTMTIGQARQASPEGGSAVTRAPRSPRSPRGSGLPNEKSPTGQEPFPAARPSTPPPLPFDRRSVGEGSPRSPGGLAWRRAGSAHNLYPNQLINDLSTNPSKKKKEILPRLVDRSRAFHQSSNKVHLRHNQGWNIYRLLRFNWFHVMLRWPSKYSFTFLVTSWTGTIVFFAMLYVWHDEINRGGRCVLGGPNGEVIGWAGAFAFSLQTCNTVGKDLRLEVEQKFQWGSLILSLLFPHRIYLAKWSQFILRKGLFGLAVYYLRTDGVVNVLQRLSHYVRLQSTWAE